MQNFEPELQNQIDFWMKFDKNEKNRKEIQSMVENNDVSSLKQCLLKRMTFGTAGLRAKMAPGNAFMNDLTIIQTTQGIARYLKQEQHSKVKKHGVVVGFDARHNSKRFADLVANILTHHNIKVMKFSDIVATPFVPYAVRIYKAVMGIMITASHNPKQDNGYKVYWNNGAQIKPPHDSGIAAAIESDLTVADELWDLSLLNNNKLLTDPLDEVFQKYFADLAVLCRYRGSNESSARRFVYTPVHGVGQKFVEEGFKRFGLKPFHSVAEQMEPDPEFSTVKYPNPEEGKGVLKLSVETAEKNNCDVIIANDPDADRLAVAEKLGDGSWKVFTGNELGALFGWWALEMHKKFGPKIDNKKVWMISSTVSSKILQSIAEEEGISFKETLTGFKWMGNEAFDEIEKGGHVIFAFEEAIGFMFGSRVLDKDGVSAACVLCEMSNYLKNKNKITLNDQLQNIYKKYGQHVSSNSYYISHDSAKTNQMFARLRNYQSNAGITDGDHVYPAGLSKGGYQVTGVRDVTTGFDSRQDDKKGLMPRTPGSEMITFYFSNGCNVTLRTSGTEPKIKYYSEIIGMGEAATLKDDLENLLQILIEDFYQPEINGFLAKST